MIYKIRHSAWNDSLEVGEITSDINDTRIKVLSIVKIETNEGITFIYVLGVEEYRINNY